MSQNWFQRTFIDAPWEIRRQAVALAALGLFVAIMIGALYLAQAASVATLGRQLEELINKRNQLEQTNEQLRSEIAQLRTVSRLLARARDLGFVQAGNQDMLYVYSDSYNPNRNQDVLSPAQAPAQTLPTYDESFVGWLQQQWDSLVSQFKSFAGNNQ